jgi:hypothetical protein
MKHFGSHYITSTFSSLLSCKTQKGGSGENIALSKETDKIVFIEVKQNFHIEQQN